MKTLKKKMEAIGLILLLLAFGWQLIEDDLNSLAGEVDVYQTHEKLDVMYSLLMGTYTKLDSNNKVIYMVGV